jgi:hypothetical protein
VLNAKFLGRNASRYRHSTTDCVCIKQTPGPCSMQTFLARQPHWYGVCLCTPSAPIFTHHSTAKKKINLPVTFCCAMMSEATPPSSTPASHSSYCPKTFSSRLFFCVCVCVFCYDEWEAGHVWTCCGNHVTNHKLYDHAVMCV